MKGIQFIIQGHFPTHMRIDYERFRKSAQPHDVVVCTDKELLGEVQAWFLIDNIPIDIQLINKGEFNGTYYLRKDGTPALCMEIVRC